MFPYDKVIYENIYKKVNYLFSKKLWSLKSKNKINKNLKIKKLKS